MQDFLKEILIVGFLFFTSLATLIHALLNKRDPRAALNWILLVLFLPAVGAVAYWIGGINRIRRRAHIWKAQGKKEERVWTDPPVHFQVSTDQISDFLKPLAILGKRLTDLPLINGNSIKPLYNGEDAYPAMLGAIDSAKYSIYLTTYIFDTDEQGMLFIDALARAKKRGVDVRILIDGLGKYYSFPTAIYRLRQKGIKAYSFLSPSSGFGLHFNLRNHRKLLLVDGEVGFTGGMNLGGRHLANRVHNPHRVVDVHFECRGPILVQLEHAFLSDWFFITGQELAKKHQAPLISKGNSVLRVVEAGPDLSMDRLHLLVVGAISTARASLYIVTPYFIPDRAIISALVNASLRGVEVHLILPHKNNIPVIKWASSAYLWELVAAGIHVYEQTGPFVHSKLLVIDHDYALVGSMNLDPRSYRLNFELNLEVYDAQFVKDIFQSIQLALKTAIKVDSQKIKNIFWLVKLRNAIAKLFSPYL